MYNFKISIISLIIFFIKKYYCSIILGICMYGKCYNNYKVVVLFIGGIVDIIVYEKVKGGKLWEFY